MAYNVRITASAARDLDEILGYIANELCNPQAAGKLLDEIAESFGRLRETPMCYAACAQPILKAYRKAVIQNYVMIYRVDGDIVYVERFFSRLEDYAQKL